MVRRNGKLFLVLFSLLTVPLPAFAADTATVSGTNQVNFTPWRMNPALMSSISDPHPDTSFPQTMSGTQSDTQFGRNVVSGFSQAELDLTTTSVVPGFQSVINRINSTPSGTSRLNQLQTQIHQNQSQVGYIFDNKFGITSMTDSAGNLIGQANGTFIQTRQEVVPGGVQTTTCVGTFTVEQVVDASTGKPLFNSDGSAVINYTNTSGTNKGQGPGCTTQ